MADLKDKEKFPLHPIQMLILNKMIFSPNARFRDLFAYVKSKGAEKEYSTLELEKVTTDHFTYHIRKLIELGLIYKTKEADKIYYKLTEFGKRFVSIMDTEKVQHEQFGKRGVLLKAARIRGGTNELEYLVYKRLKQPFYGYYGFHTGKVRFGESVVDAAFREFKEETGLEIIDYELVGIYHQIGIKPDGTLLRDIYFYEFYIYDFAGMLLKENKEEGVLNEWLTKAELKDKPTYPDFWNRKLKLNWTHFPKFFARYIKLKKAGKWVNKPRRLTDISMFHEIKPYFVERIKIIENW